MENPDWGDDPKYSTRAARQRNSNQLWELLSSWTRPRSKYEIAREGQRRRIPCFPVNTVSDLLSDPHLEERKFFVTIEHPLAGEIRHPGVAYRLSGADLPLHRPAPTLGQHNRDVLA